MLTNTKKNAEEKYITRETNDAVTSAVYLKNFNAKLVTLDEKH